MAAIISTGTILTAIGRVREVGVAIVWINCNVVDQDAGPESQETEISDVRGVGAKLNLQICGLDRAHVEIVLRDAQASVTRRLKHSEEGER